MSKLNLILPKKEHKEIILDYKKEFLENKDSMDGSAGLSTAKTFEEWFSSVQDNLKEETVRDGFVPSTTYLAFNNENKLVGMIDIRHRLNDYLLNFGGHIGYSIRKSERQKGYATEMLNLALKECMNLKIKKVLITCDKNNIASAKTIINNGGKLENEIAKEDKVTQRYYITLF